MTSVGPPRTTFTLAGVKRGAVAVQPLALGVFVYGVTFGLLALGSGLTLAQALLLSGIVYSGSAQIAIVGALATGTGLVAAAISIALLNARYLFYGASLRPWLAPAGTMPAYGSLFFLGDGNWVLSMRARAAGEEDAGYVLGSGIATYAAWVAGTALASVAGAWLPRPSVLGLDFLLVAFCAAMAVDALRERPDRAWALVALVAGGIALAVDRYASPGWAIVAAGVGGVAVAFFVQPVRKREAA